MEIIQFKLSRGTATENSPRWQPWVKRENVQSPGRGERRRVDESGFSVAPPGLEKMDTPNPRLTPWATIFRHSVAAKRDSTLRPSTVRCRAMPLGDLLKSTYCLSQLRVTFMENYFAKIELKTLNASKCFSMSVLTLKNFLDASSSSLPRCRTSLKSS